MRPSFGPLGIIISLEGRAILYNISHVHGSNGVWCRGFFQKGIDRALMQAGFEEVLEFGEDLIQVRSQLNFQTGTLLNSLLAEAAKFFEFDVIEIL